MRHPTPQRDAYRGKAIPVCYYDIDDTGFYDEFGNPIDPSQMDDYLMYGGTDFTVDPAQSQDYYQQLQQGYGQQPQQEEYWVEDEIGNRHKIRGRKNFDDYINGFF